MDSIKNNIFYELFEPAINKMAHYKHASETYFYVSSFYKLSNKS